MIKNYFLTAVRSLLRKKTFTFINVVGFGLGLSCALLIMAFVWDELNYDTYHLDGDRSYRIALTRHFPDRENTYATTPSPLGPTLYQEFPEVETYSRIFDPVGETRIEIGDQVYYEDRFFAADSSFFDIFSLELIAGNPEEALKAPNSVVLTEETSIKYFGKANALNESIEVGDGTVYSVTGIVRSIPKRSHFKFDLLASLESFPISESTFWGSYSIHNYVKLKETGLVGSVIDKLPALMESRMGPQVESILGKTWQEYVDAGNIHEFFFQPISSIHLHSHFTNELGPNGDYANVMLFLVISILILGIAGFNFTNLATAYAVKRSKEIGVRKVLGSSRKQLVVQFLVESTLVTTLAVILALALVYLVLPTFNVIADRELAFSDFNPLVSSVFLLMLILIVGVASGIYPAFFITGFKTVEIFKGGIKLSNSKFGLRNILVTIQFAASIFMVLATLFILFQLDYMMNKKLGFKEQNMILIEVSNNLQTNYRTFMDELKNEPYISDVSSSFHVPGRQSGGGTFQAIGIPATERFLFQLYVTDYRFFNNYELDLTSGRFFDEELSTDTAAVIINESCAKMVGWTPENAVGEQIRITGQQFNHRVVGVVRDFHATSLREPISPMVFLGIPEENINQTNPSTLTVKLNDQVKLTDAMDRLEEKWMAEVPGEDFRYAFLDTEFNQLYENERRFSDVFKSFSMIAILISLIGVIGLSLYIAAEKTKEIGIRKVLGASSQQILVLLSRDFLYLMIAANVIIWPLTYVLLKQWIGSFAYAIEINPFYFLVIGIAFAVVVLITIGTVTYRAASSNPVDSIGYE